MPHNTDLWAIPPHMAEEILRTLHGHLRPAPEGASPLAEPRASLPSIADTEREDKGYTVTQGVAVITISGTLTRKGYRSYWSGELVSHGQDTIRVAVQSALTDPAVRGILFSVNSPGGVVPGTKELADFVAEAATRKPCAAYVDGLAASAAYWLASATGRIYAPVTASVGSIGVIMTHTDWSKWNEKAGLAITTICSGQWKDAGSPDRPLTKAERTYFQQRITAVHEIFKADVRKGMGLTAPEAAWAEAQIFLAAEALPLGLITATVQDLPAAISNLQTVSEGWRPPQPPACHKGAQPLLRHAKEIHMDKATLAAQHPDLLAQIQAEARQEAEADSHARMQATLTVVKTVGGEQTFAAIKSTMELCAAAKLTPEQMLALAPVLAAQAAPAAGTAPSAVEPPTAPAPTGEQAAMQQLLSAMQAATPAPLTVDPKTQPSPQAKSPLIADAEYRAQRG